MQSIVRQKYSTGAKPFKEIFPISSDLPARVFIMAVTFPPNF